VRKLLLLVLIVACDKGEHRDAREKFNAGVDQLAAGKFEDAEKTLLEARSSAGVGRAQGFLAPQPEPCRSFLFTTPVAGPVAATPALVKDGGK